MLLELDHCPDLPGDVGADRLDHTLAHQSDGIGFADVGPTSPAATNGHEALKDRGGTNSSETGHLKARTIFPTRLVTSLRQGPESGYSLRIDLSVSEPNSRARIWPWSLRRGRAA